MSKAILATIPGNLDSNTLLEIASEQTPEGKSLVVLQHLTWGEGLGWCPQQSLRLSPDEAEALLHSLRTTRQLWRERSPGSSGQVIPFRMATAPAVQKRNRKTQTLWQQKRTGESI